MFLYRYFLSLNFSLFVFSLELSITNYGSQKIDK
jgi:hypothetical protein